MLGVKKFRKGKEQRFCFLDNCQSSFTGNFLCLRCVRAWNKLYEARNIKRTYFTIRGGEKKKKRVISLTFHLTHKKIFDPQGNIHHSVV